MMPRARNITRAWNDAYGFPDQVERSPALAVSLFWAGGRTVARSGSLSETGAPRITPCLRMSVNGVWGNG